MKLIKNNLAIYQNSGEKENSIIFVHGFPYDHIMWNAQVKHLSNDYNVITYDIRGLGESEAGDGQFTMEMFVDDLFFILDELKVDKPVICGLSMGGYLAFRALEREEKRFSAAIFCDTKPEADNNLARLKRASAIKRINEEGLKNYVEDTIPATFAEESKQKLGGIYFDIINRAAQCSPVGVKGAILAMSGRLDTSNYLPQISIPVLVVCGEKDVLTPPEQMSEMAGKIKNSKFVIIPGSGHMSSVENPAAVNAAIEEFLKDLYGR